MQELKFAMTPGLYRDDACMDRVYSWEELCEKGVVKLSEGKLSGTSTVEEDSIIDGVLVLPRNVENICTYAFTSEPKLRGLVSHETIKSIGVSAFAGCKNLEFVDIRCENICENAFMRCTSLKKLSDKAGNIIIGNSAFGWCSTLEKLTLTEGAKVHSGALLGCEQLYHVEYV